MILKSADNQLPTLPEPHSASAAEIARYIGEMAGSLAALAGAQRVQMLTYFLNMARVEAEMQALELSERDSERPPERARGTG